jgi:hypothetical protein
MLRSILAGTLELGSVGVFVTMLLVFADAARFSV